jgi:flagellar motor switch protein FliG
MRTAKKLAIFFTSIPRERAVSIMRNFTVRNMEIIASEIRSLGQIPKQTQTDVFHEVAEKVASGIDVQGGDDVAKMILTDVVGEQKAKEILEKAKPKKPLPFSTITHVSGQDLATILSNEQASTAALILGFFPPKKVGEVLAFFDQEFREEVVVRLAQNRNTDTEIVERIEEIFVGKVTSAVNPSDELEESRSLGGPEFIAEMFQGVDKELEEEMLSSIQEESEELANQIRDMMFTFEDVIKLSDPDIQKVLREVPMDKLVIALRGASPAIYEKFTNNLSKRAKENLKEEMDMMGKVKKSQIEGERKAIVGIIRALEAAGEIQATAGGEEDVYV